MPCGSCTPRAVASMSGTDQASRTAANSHTQTPCGYASEASAATNAIVGAFECLDGENAARFDNHTFTDIQTADFLGNVESKMDIVDVPLSEIGPRHVARASDVILQKGHGVEQLETDAGELIGDFAKERLGIASLQFCQQDQGTKVGTQVEEVCRRKLAGHHGMACARFPGGFE